MLRMEAVFPVPDVPMISVFVLIVPIFLFVKLFLMVPSLHVVFLHRLTSSFPLTIRCRIQRSQDCRHTACFYSRWALPWSSHAWQALQPGTVNTSCALMPHTFTVLLLVAVAGYDGLLIMVAG
jgi:hypothetical protein